MSEPTVVHEPEQHRWAIRVDGALAGFAEYRRTDDRYVFTHTEIDDAFEGQGLGSRLAKAALDDVRAEGRQAVPLCPFIRRYVDKHAEYADLVDEETYQRLTGAEKGRQSPA